MDSLNHLILKEAPPLDPAWLAYEEEVKAKGPKKTYASPLARQPVYAEECRQLNARMLAPGAPYHHLSSVTTQPLNTPSSLDQFAIPILRFSNDNNTPISDEIIVVYYHGGGLYVGEADSEELSCRRIAKDFEGATVYSVGYRLMPSSPASTCVSDSLDAFHRIRSLHPSPATKLIIIGSSSGGQLAAAVSQTVPRGSFHAVLLRCPVTSDGGSSLDFVPPSLRYAYTSPTSPSFVTSLLGVFSRAVPRDGLESMPLEAGAETLAALPRTWVQVCSNDTLYSDGVCYAMALAGAGVEVEVEVVRGWPHTFWLKAPWLARAVEAEEEMVRGLRWVLGR
ncbi:Alpha/Beta hydrolase protein [Colletotrichum godetiae]|uniref:Alpha/Beta hydrolase protein n=1 Tax=Colletotrichum godetiae TaxID=1209918 RepID=A0AAJ0AF28_9PEZI|nr:Alpha/Beta hydrolase protein [Colletotrichum godetiae]KAK1672709.1 Alpha/Beta hydrolase protein [Colletotrichum godetiae]